MLRIVDRYLVRELLVSFLAAVAILLLVTVGATVADLLAKIARGRVAADLLLALIGLRTVDSLTLLVPMALFLAVQLAYGRLYRESEMAVFAASGLPVTGLVRPLLLLAVPMTFAMALISFWLAPAAVRQAQALQEEASRSLIVAGLEPGRFVELPNNDGVMYVDSMNADGTKFQKMFVASERTDAEAGHINLNVITAADGELYHDANGAERYLGLNDGFRVEGVLGQDNYRLMRYARNDVKLTDTETDTNADSVKRSAPTRDLLASNDLVQRTEFQWRLAAPLSVLVLVLLALPLAKSSPREPRYARLLIALLAWVIYYNCLAIGRSKLSQGVFDPRIGFWWVQVPTALIALFLLWRSQRLPRPRAAARARTGAA
ncbi:MAG TPA: LPS export ABC transporter permease LptF [Rhodanobacteraceae bacterium]|nr:LPS export ABC transporter permease LptF [Rhodanobacteraceae bacterium]